jgi:hypothetical protein
MWAFIWLGLISFTVLSVLVLNHLYKQADGFVGATIINQQDANTDVSRTDLNANRNDPSCAMGQISTTPGKICTGMSPAGTGQSQKPTDYTVEIAKSTKVSQPPFPPCVGYVDEVVYAPTDTNADIASIKSELALLRKNMPNYIADGVNQQAGIIVKGMLRQQGFPLTDDKYGQNESPLNCN